MGCLNQLWAATTPEALNHNGAYVIPWTRLGQPVKQTQDPEVGKELWAWLEKQVEVSEAS